MSFKTHKQISVNGNLVNAFIVDDFSLNNYIEKDPELLAMVAADEAKTATAAAAAKKVRAKDIIVKSGVIPSKNDILTLSLHGQIQKIILIEKSYFVKPIREELIIAMKNKLDEIKKWIMEDKDMSETKVAYLTHRKNNILKIIHYFRSMDKEN